MKALVNDKFVKFTEKLTSIEGKFDTTTKEISSKLNQTGMKKKKTRTKSSNNSDDIE